MHGASCRIVGGGRRWAVTCEASGAVPHFEIVGIARDRRDGLDGLREVLVARHLLSIAPDAVCGTFKKGSLMRILSFPLVRSLTWLHQ
jgi:hypothetical protein